MPLPPLAPPSPVTIPRVADVTVRSTTLAHFGFSTLGCPDLDVDQLRTLAAQNGQRRIELRAIEGSLDVPAMLARFAGGAAAVRDFFLEAGVRVQLIGSSFLLTESAISDRTALAREAEAAEALGARWLRVFGSKTRGTPFSAESAAIARDHRQWWSDLRTARGWTVDLILETHDAFISATEVSALFGKTGGPMPLLWDTHHSWKIAQESLDYTWSQLGPHVQHVHVKDSVSSEKSPHGYSYVPPGRGEFPMEETLGLLAQNNFAGMISLEWEKRWHPELAALDQVLPDWNRVIAPFAEAAPIAKDAPVLLLKTDFDHARIVPAAGPYFHGAREQYDDIEGPSPTAHSPTLGEPTPTNPRLGKLRLYYEGGDRRQRTAELADDESNPGKRLLRFRLNEPNVTLQWPDGPQHKSRIQTEVYGNVELRDFFLSVRFRLHADTEKLTRFPGKIDWFTLMEFWNNAGWTGEPFPFRFGFHLVKLNAAPGSPLYFATASQHQVDAKTYKDVWHVVNEKLPVPFGSWLTTEIYFKEGDAQHGRFYAAITPDGGNRTVLFDVRGWTHHPENKRPMGMKQFSPLKLYTSAEVVNFLREQGSFLEVDWQDLEIWRGVTPEPRVVQ